MTLNDFTALVSSTTDPVILIEGRRSISESSAASARQVAALFWIDPAPVLLTSP